MNIGQPVETMAAAVYTAIGSPDVLPDIERTIRQETRMMRPGVTDISVIHFPQLWGSTSLGFGGMGGAAMTTAYTTVILCDKNAAVFFNGHHCYSVDNVNEAFMDDVNKRRMASLSEAEKRY